MYWGSWEPVRFSETSRLEERVSSSGCEAKVAWDISKPSLLRVRSEAAGVEKGAKGLADAILCDGLGGRERKVDRFLGCEGVCGRGLVFLLLVLPVLLVGKVGCRVYRSANDAGQCSSPASVLSLKYEGVSKSA